MTGGTFILEGAMLVLMICGPIVGLLWLTGKDPKDLR